MEQIAPLIQSDKNMVVSSVWQKIWCRYLALYLYSRQSILSNAYNQNLLQQKPLF